MKSNPSFLILSYLIGIFIDMTLTSCKGKVILPDIKFGLTESQVKDEAIKLTRVKDLIMAIKDDDASCYRGMPTSAEVLKVLLN